MYDDVGSSLTEMWNWTRRRVQTSLAAVSCMDRRVVGLLEGERQQKRCESVGLETEEGKREYLYLSPFVY